MINQQQRAKAACTLELQHSVFGASRLWFLPGQPRGGAGTTLDKDSLDREAAANSHYSHNSLSFSFSLFLWTI